MIESYPVGRIRVSRCRQLLEPCPVTLEWARNEIRPERELGTRFLALNALHSSRPAAPSNPISRGRKRGRSRGNLGNTNRERSQHPVTVRRDRWGVPHIYAQNQHDLFFAQGFVAAQDRLFQMEMWKRAGQGRLAEMLGAAVGSTRH